MGIERPIARWRRRLGYPAWTTSPSEISSQLENGIPKENSINYNLTDNIGLSSTAPIFIDFHFITNIQTINSVKSYLLSANNTTSIPQSPEFERLGLVIQHSPNGDFFEIYGIYNDTIYGFKKFIDDSFTLDRNYYVQYDITLYEQNIRGKTTTITVTDNFNETIEYRPIIKYSSTTAIIDVEMRLIDSVDDSTIIRRASYGMLQDEVAKYSLNLTKINLANASKPKIYNIKSPEGAGIFGNSGNTAMGKSQIILEPIKINYTVLSDRFNVYPNSETLPNSFFNSISIIKSISCFSNGLKTITSSIRFKNSGAKLVNATIGGDGAFGYKQTEQQKILNECTEKKISLVKLQSVLLKQTTGGSGGGGPMGKLTLSDEDRVLLDKLVNDGSDNKEESNYKL